MLQYVKSSPSMYAAPRMQYLREFVSHVSRHPNDFPPVDGDDTITLFAPGRHDYRPTKGYVQALAELRSTSAIADNPIFRFILSILVTTRTYQVVKTPKL